MNGVATIEGLDVRVPRDRLSPNFGSGKMDSKGRERIGQTDLSNPVV